MVEMQTKKKKKRLENLEIDATDWKQIPVATMELKII